MTTDAQAPEPLTQPEKDAIFQLARSMSITLDGKPARLVAVLRAAGGSLQNGCGVSRIVEFSFRLESREGHPRKPRRSVHVMSESKLLTVEPQAFPLDPSKKYLVVLEYIDGSLADSLGEAEKLRLELKAMDITNCVVITTKQLSLRLYVQQLRGGVKLLESL